MKKSHKKMLIFQLLILLIFILNSFVSNILGGYNFIIFLLIALILFKYLFGFEKNKQLYSKDIIFEVIIILLSYFMIIYLLGIFTGFARISNYYTWYGLKTFIIPLVLTIFLKEILRYMMLKKSEGSKLLFIITTILFIFLDVTEAIYYNAFDSNYNTFIFISLSLLPAISRNISFNYVTCKVGYKPVILYLLLTQLYVYLIPIIPNLNEYLTAIVGLILPLVFYYSVYMFFEKEKDNYIYREYKKKSIISLVIPVLITIFVVYFTSGYFKYYALAIASGSMSPKINKGDVVIVEKINGKYDKLEEGMIIAYEHSGVVVVHRISKIINNDGQYYFYTKGDANSKEDNYVVYDYMIIGVVSVNIPYVGMPTVWLNEM